MIARNRATAEQHKQAREAMAARLPTVIAEIDSLVTDIATLVERLPVTELLQRAWWEYAHTVIKLEGKEPGGEEVGALNTLAYLQSVVASTTPAQEVSGKITEREWSEVTTKTRMLFRLISFDYQMCLTASRTAENPDIDMALEEFRYRAEMLWANVRGKRYQSHESIALSELLAPHSDVLLRLFGLDANSLAGELEKLLHKLTFGLQEMMIEFGDLQKETLAKVDEISSSTGITDVSELRKILHQDREIVDRMEKSMGEMFGLDLFDVGKITHLPRALLAELTWGRGEEKTFLAPGRFAGWPLRVWPTMMRPFVRLNDRVLCFDAFSLFDHFYRVLQRVIFRLAPEYRTTWNDRQKAVSEALPVAYLRKIMPDGHAILSADIVGLQMGSRHPSRPMLYTFLKITSL